MKNLPEIEHPTGRPNFTLVTVNGVEYAFSYSTCIAFCDHDGQGWTLRENDWGPTTGRHLNWLPQGRGPRLSGQNFLIALAAISDPQVSSLTV